MFQFGKIRAVWIVVAITAMANLVMPRADAARRIALVIGNDTYQTLPALNNAATDARGMAVRLGQLGFDVILKLNAGRRAMGRALAEFEGKTAGADVAMMFYAGHGIQAGGRNYLIPADAYIEVEDDLRFEGIAADEFLAAMKTSGDHLNIIIIDACRDNPLPRRSRSAARGLTVTHAPATTKGTAIIYAAAPGQTAQDGPKGGHGVFTGELLAVLAQPGLNLEQVFKQTARRVALVTGGKQDPWITSSVKGEFYFNAAAPNVPVAPAPSGGSAELLFWETIKDAENSAAFQAYLQQYPDGPFATLARLKLEDFTQAAINLEPIEETYVAVRNANVRATPAADALKVTMLVKGSKVHVAGKVASKDWLAVDRDGKRLGYVFARLLQNPDEARAEALVAAKAERENSWWDSIKNSKNRAFFKIYLTQYPQGRFSAQARLKLDQLKPRKVAAIIPPKVMAPGIDPVRRPGDSFKDCADCPEMVVVPSGSFTMGDLQGGGFYYDEIPAHDVRIDYGFAIGKFEVTFAQWDACVAGDGCDGYRPKDLGLGRGRHPVIYISWDDAKAYVNWLSRKTGKDYRLLSEAEWECMARAGTKTEFHTGDQITPDQANYVKDGSTVGGIVRNKMVAVGSFHPNPFGLYDVHGNVWEWVEDCWHNNYQDAPANGSPWAKGGDCSRRVMRGGSWDASWAANLRAANRFKWETGARNYDFGFRVARTLSQ